MAIQTVILGCSVVDFVANSVFLLCESPAPFLFASVQQCHFMTCTSSDYGLWPYVLMWLHNCVRHLNLSCFSACFWVSKYHVVCEEGRKLVKGGLASLFIRDFTFNHLLPFQILRHHLYTFGLTLSLEL